MALDTAGAPLAAALKEGCYLLKPSLRELQELAHAPLLDPGAWLEASRSLVKTGGVEVVALTLGHRGALLVTQDSAFRAYTPDVQVVSAGGAGDSFFGAMVWHLASGTSITEAFRYGVGAGSAAVINPGTELCQAADVIQLYNEVQLESLYGSSLQSAA
jgi:6-phosphofructokinase 2